MAKYTGSFLPKAKHDMSSVMVWAAITWLSVGSIIALQDNVTANNYVTILGDYLYHMGQYLFPDNDSFYQDDNAPVSTTKIIMDWALQSPKIIINNHKRALLETKF